MISLFLLLHLVLQPTQEPLTIITNISVSNDIIPSPDHGRRYTRSLILGNGHKVSFVVTDLLTIWRS